MFESVPDELKACRQWVLWRYEGRGGKPTKVPYQVSGQRASSVDPSHWVGFDEAIAAAPNWDGVGFVFAPGSGLVGIDLDDCLDEFRAIEPWALEVLDRLGSYAEVSPSGRGIKVWAKGQLPTDRGRKVKIEGGALEVYSQGRYFTVTGQNYVHSANRRHEVAECQVGLDWLAQTYLPEQPKHSTSQVYTPRPLMEGGTRSPLARAEAYADSYPPAISGQDGHGVTFRLACVLVNGFDLGEGPALQILERWNSTCQPPWSEQELEHKIRDAASKGAQDGEVGYMFASDDQLLDSAPEECSEEELQTFRPHLGQLLASLGGLTGEFPEHLLEVPGFVQETASWITSQNPKPNRVISLLGGVSLQAHLAGRKVQDESGLRTNLFLVVLAPSSGGKQAPQTCIKKVLSLAGMSGSFGGKVASDSALGTDLMEEPAKLYLWDEFGRWLKRTQNRRDLNLMAVQDSLLELWSEAASPAWKQKSLRDKKYSIEVCQPCLNMLGLTVPLRFWEGLDDEHLEDGFAARFLVVDTGPRVESQDVVASDPPGAVLDRAMEWRDYKPGGNLASQYPQPAVVSRTEGAARVLGQLREKQESMLDDGPSGAIWGRAHEKASKLALVYACSRSLETPIIDTAAATWASDLVSWSTRTFLAKATDEVASDDWFAQRSQRVLKLVKGYNQRLEPCTRQMLMRKTRWKAKELDEVLNTLLEAGLLDVKAMPTSGRPKTIYLAT